MSQWVLHLLGSPRLEREGIPVAIQRRKVMALLIYLAVTGKSHPRDSLAAFFWPEHDQIHARAALRRTLSELQKLLGDKVLLVEQDSIGLEHNADFWLDINEFHSNLTAYRAHGHHPDDPCSDCLTALTEAVSLYKDDFLAGFTLSDSPDFDEWQILEAEILHRELIGALSRLVMGYTADGEIGAAIGAAHRWLTLDPVDERAHRHLMQLYTWNSQRSEALRQYQECVRTLQQELGVPPLDETTRLYEHIRAQKDLHPPEGTSGTLSAIPPQLAAPQHKPHRLPVQLTSFVGRAAELVAVREEITRPEVHLLTLTGPGGVGKTRLSLEVAASLIDQFEDGVFFVALAAIRDPALVGPTIAHTLGVRESQGKSSIESLTEYIRDRQLLLVLDNFEHLTKAAPLVTELLSAASHTKVLVTSRVLLHVYGEHLHPVLPLKLPRPGRVAEPESMVQPEAVQLFIERARAVKPDFALTRENYRTLAALCSRLDGLPLAIELAAARVRQISPQAMLSQWAKESGGSPLQTLTGGPRDLPARHKTLRNAIAWSYNLLDAREQAVFRRAGVFKGGWTQEAAEKIIGEPRIGNDYPARVSSPDSPVVDLLESLVDTNLFQQAEVGNEIRFSMLETIREYTLERLVECRELDALRHRHAEFFLALAEMAKMHLSGPQQVVWMNRLEQEYGNLRAALKWSVDCQNAEIALRLGSALGKFWYTYDPLYWSEGRNWLEQALNLKQPEAVPFVVRANALNEAGVLAWAQIDYRHASLCFEECLALRKILGEKAGIASALGNLGLVTREQQDLARSRAYQEECLAIQRELGDKKGIATALSNLALVAADEGEYEYAISLYEESLVLNRELQNMAGLTLTLHNLGGLLVENRGDYSIALSMLMESLKLSRELGRNFFLIPHTLNHLGNLYLNRADFKQARDYFDESLNLSRESDNKYGIGHALHGLGRLDHLQGECEQAQEFYKKSVTALHEINAKVVIIWNLIALADLACGHGQFLRAATLLGASEKLRQITSTSLPLIRRDEYERAIANVRGQLDEAQFNEFWARGREMSVDQTVAYAIGESGEHLDSNDPAG
jgi:predicted ATPase/DNA-binding SARP family transcriptional activator/Tfp pilus assembly protein PilF